MRKWNVNGRFNVYMYRYGTKLKIRIENHPENLIGISFFSNVCINLLQSLLAHYKIKNTSSFFYFYFSSFTAWHLSPSGSQIHTTRHIPNWCCFFFFISSVLHVVDAVCFYFAHPFTHVVFLLFWKSLADSLLKKIAHRQFIYIQNIQI